MERAARHDDIRGPADEPRGLGSSSRYDRPSGLAFAYSGTVSMNRAGRTSQVVGRGRPEHDAVGLIPAVADWASRRDSRHMAAPRIVGSREQLDPTYGLLAGLRDHSSNRIG